MNVRVCGPNLNDQSKGTFHVHAENCSDLARYGPYRKRGGDANGEQEMLVVNASLLRIITMTYGDQIDEQPEEERASYIRDLASDFWIAPCAKPILFS